MEINKQWLKKTAFVAFCAYAALLFFYSGYYFFKNQLYLSNTDSFYYYNVAENLYHSGKLQSTVLKNPEKVGTPQTGIILIMTAFLEIGLERDSVFIAVSLLYFLLYTAGAYPLFRLGRLAGLSSFAGAALVIAYLTITSNLHENMQVLNDGAFNTLALWVLLFTAQFFEMEKDRSALSTPGARYFRTGALVIIFSSALLIFRVQGLLLVFSAVLAALYLAVKKRSFSAALFAGIFLCITLALYYSVNHSLGVQRQGFFSQATVASVFAFNHVLQKTVLFAQGYLFFSAALFFLSRTLFKLDNIVRLFLSIICLFTIVFTFSFDYNLIVSRYLTYIWPVTFLFILIEPRLRHAGYALILLTMLQSTLTCRRVHEFYCYEPLYLYMHARGITLPPQSDVVSYPAYDRISRYFLQAPVWHSIEQCIDTLKEMKPLFIVGPRDYLSEQLTLSKSIASRSTNDIVVDTVSAGFADQAGDALIRLYLRNRVSANNRVPSD
jgi:hypothetical protein